MGILKHTTISANLFYERASLRRAALQRLMIVGFGVGLIWQLQRHLSWDWIII
jgi:hypothetical protein